MNKKKCTICHCSVICSHIIQNNLFLYSQNVCLAKLTGKNLYIIRALMNFKVIFFKYACLQICLNITHKIIL